MAKIKSDVKKFTEMAVGATLLGTGMGIMGDAASTMPAPAKSMVGAAGTVYAAKYLQDISKDIDIPRKKSKGGWGI